MAKAGKLKKDGTPSKQGENGGAPPKYSKKEEFEALFVQYTTDCAEKQKILTKAGWLHVLDVTRVSYARYKKKKKFGNTLKQIEFLIEDAWLQRLTATGATGAIFYLKNAFKEEYKDRNETDMTLRTPKPLLDVLHNNGSKKNIPAQ